VCMDSERQKRGGGIGRSYNSDCSNSTRQLNKSARRGEMIWEEGCDANYSYSFCTQCINDDAGCSGITDNFARAHKRGWERMARIIWWGIGKEVDGTQHKHTKKTYADSAILELSSGEPQTTFSRVAYLISDKKSNSE